MPLLKKIIRSGPREVIVKWTGSGTDTLTLASLIQTGQTVSGTPSVNIVSVSSSQASGGASIITRNTEVALHVHDNYEFQTNGNILSILDENSTSDIAVSLVNIGTLVLRLKKTQGYTGI